MSSRAGRPQRAPAPPLRLNAFQLHYVDQVIPKYQSGPSFTAYDESLEAAYDWLCNFEDALKNDADPALLAKTPGKATAKKVKATVKPLPVSRPPLFELSAARQNAPAKAKTVAIAGTSKAAPQASKPAPAPAVPSSPIVVVVDTPAPALAPSTRSRASSFGEDQTDDDDKVKTGFGGKSRPASLFSQLSLASTAATSASEWEASQDQEAGTRRESKADVVVDNKSEEAGDASPVVPADDRLSVVEEVVTPPVVSEAAPCPLAATLSVNSPVVEAALIAVLPQPVTEVEPFPEEASVAAVVEPPSSPMVATVESAPGVEEAAPDAAVDQVAAEAVAPAADAAPAVPPKPSRTVVRSSWLRSALGGAEIGAPVGPGAGGARKSQGAALVAAAREREKEREREMVPASSTSATDATPKVAGAKRKSDEAQLVEDTVDDEEDNTIRSALQRSTKMLKLDERPLPSSSTLPTTQNSSTTPFKRALFSPPFENEQPEDGMSRVRKAMEELSARTKGRGMSTVGLGTLGGSILGNQSLVGRLTMPAGQTAAGTPTFGSMLMHNLGEDVAILTPEDAEPKRLEEPSTAVPIKAPVESAKEDAEADDVEAVVPRAPSPVVLEVNETPAASVKAPSPPASPEVQERSFEIIDLTQSISSLPPSPKRLSAPSPANGQSNNAPSSFGSLMGDLEHATASPSPPPTPPPAVPVTKPTLVAKKAAASSIFRGTTPPRPVKTAAIDNTTTPMASPPKKRVSSNDGELTLEDLEMSVVVDEEEEVRVLVNAPKDRLAAGVPKMREAEAEMEEEHIMDVAPRKPQQQTAAARSRENSLVPGSSKLKQSLTRSVRPESRLAASSSSQGFSRMAADKIAGKKPKVDDVKSLQAAAEAAKKEQELRERRAAVSKLAEAIRLRSAAQKAADEKAKEEEAKRVKMEELKERRARAAEVEKRRKEREARDKEKRDQLAAAKAAEEESKKRKQAPTAVSGSQPKRQQSLIGPSSIKVPTGKIATKMGMAPSAAAASGKVVPSFSHLPPGPKAGSSQTAPSTIRLVGSSMGPPVRTSDMGRSIVGPKGAQANRASQAQGAQVLQAQRQALQSQILSKSQGQQSPRVERPGESEAIELADIDSEYSDSDDEDRPRSGKDAPAWAQSPEIRSALRSQEMHNPDDIFGRMKPLSMEEVFRARAGKFRARTSSANWTHDGVTPQEEVAYAGRMGWAEK